MSFRFSLEGFGHEGFALVALDDSAEGNAEGNTLASGGGCLGYGDHMECGSEGHTPLLGWMVEFDTNVNAWDPTEGNHVAFVPLQGEQDSHIFWTDIDEIQDNGWHDMNLSVLDGIFQIELDGVLLLEEIFDGQPRCCSTLGEWIEFSRIYWIYRFRFCRNATGR